MRLHTDASTLGIRFVLLQRARDSDEEWKTLQVSSRILTDTETRYAIIKLECLAVAWAVKKCQIFLSGLSHFTVVTDHNPLVPILNTHKLDKIENPRLQHLRTWLMAYNFTAQRLKGTQKEAADALSQHSHHTPSVGDDLTEYDTDGNLTLIQAPSITQIRALNKRQCMVKMSPKWWKY